MARIRSIKPEIVEDEALGACSLGAQLLFDRLILHADDYGNQTGSPTMLSRALFPHSEEVNGALVRGWLDELEAGELVARYTVRRQSFVHLRSWVKNQRVEHPGKPLYPGPDQADPHTNVVNPHEDLTSPREALANAPESLTPDQDQDQDQDHDARAPAHEARAHQTPEVPAEVFTSVWNANCEPLPTLRKAPLGEIKTRLVRQAMDYFDNDLAALAAGIRAAAADDLYRSHHHGFMAFCRNVERWGAMTPVKPASNGHHAEPRRPAVPFPASIDAAGERLAEQMRAFKAGGVPA